MWLTPLDMKLQLRPSVLIVVPTPPPMVHKFWIFLFVHWLSQNADISNEISNLRSILHITNAISFPAVLNLLLCIFQMTNSFVASYHCVVSKL